MQLRMGLFSVDIYQHESAERAIIPVSTEKQVRVGEHHLTILLPVLVDTVREFETSEWHSKLPTPCHIP